MHLGFKCHQCGKCCNSAPTFLIQEVYDFSKDFLFHGVIDVRDLSGFIVDPDQNPMNHRIYMIDNNRYLVCVGLYGLYSKKKCPKLLPDGKCSLHLKGRFPLSCGTVPLYPFVDSSKIYKEKLKPCVKKYHCVVNGIKAASAPGYDHFLQSDRYNENSELVKALRKEEAAFSEPCQINLTDMIHFMMSDDDGPFHDVLLQLLNELMDNGSFHIYANILPIYLLLALKMPDENLKKLFPDCWLSDKEKIHQFARNQWELLHKPETIAMIESGTDFSVKQWENYLQDGL